MQHAFSWVFAYAFILKRSVPEKYCPKCKQKVFPLYNCAHSIILAVYCRALPFGITRVPRLPVSGVIKTSYNVHAFLTYLNYEYKMLNYDRSYSSLPGPYYLWNNPVPIARLRAANGANVAVQPTENNLYHWHPLRSKV